MKCVILDDYQNAALKMADWAQLSPHVKVTSLSQHFINEVDLIHAIQEYQIAVVMRERTPFQASVLEKLPNLKLLITSGMRNAAIDLIAAEKRGIIVCGTKSASEPPAELTWGLILGLARNIPQEHFALRANGRWQSTVGTGLYGKKLGLLGLGKIGSQVANVGAAFGMKVLAWSQNLTAELATAKNVTLAESKHTLLRESDFVSIHLVLSDRTRNLIDEDALAMMKPTAYLINTSRASIVNQDALIKALRDKRIAGAGLDVFDCEPLPHDHPYRRLPNVLATPHLGYVVDTNYKTYFQEAIQNIFAFLDGNPVRVLTTTKTPSPKNTL